MAVNVFIIHLEKKLRKFNDIILLTHYCYIFGMDILLNLELTIHLTLQFSSLLQTDSLQSKSTAMEENLSYDKNCSSYTIHHSCTLMQKKQIRNQGEHAKEHVYRTFTEQENHITTHWGLRSHV